LIVDVNAEPIEFWVIEVVATDGPITERRKKALIKWAESQGIPASQLRYLTAFLPRQHSAARKSLPNLVEGTFAWFLDEPEYEMSWGRIQSMIPANVVSLAGRTPA
jgi:hypothetical protein